MMCLAPHPLTHVPILTSVVEDVFEKTLLSLDPQPEWESDGRRPEMANDDAD